MSKNISIKQARTLTDNDISHIIEGARRSVSSVRDKSSVSNQELNDVIDDLMNRLIMIEAAVDNFLTMSDEERDRVLSDVQERLDSCASAKEAHTRALNLYGKSFMEAILQNDKVLVSRIATYLIEYFEKNNLPTEPWNEYQTL